MMYYNNSLEFMCCTWLELSNLTFSDMIGYRSVKLWGNPLDKEYYCVCPVAQILVTQEMHGEDEERKRTTSRLQSDLLSVHTPAWHGVWSCSWPLRNSWVLSSCSYEIRERCLLLCISAYLVDKCEECANTFEWMGLFLHKGILLITFDGYFNDGVIST